jgi:pimeloyl-ACP methyl ester carboxylesterase
MRRSISSRLLAALLLLPSGLLFSQADNFTFYSDLAEQWYQGGDYFEWTSTTVNNNSAKLNVFYQTFGDSSNPQLLIIHGFPNSSFDFHRLIPLLEDDYYIAALDFPGSGFSDKPLAGFSYMLEDNARLVDYFVREVVEFDDFAMFTHDRGVSIGLAFLGHYIDNPNPGYTLNYHFLSNSGMLLPLANLVLFQFILLDAQRGPEMIAARKAAPRRTEGDPESVAYADIFKFNDGDSALLHVGKYLLERAENEFRWLDNLPRSPVPVAYLWGMTDNINPIRIPNYVWLTYLNEREVESSFWMLPTAGHYPQREKPEAVAKIVRRALTGGVPDRESENQFMRSYGGSREADDAIFVGHSVVQKMEFPGSVIYTPEGYR